jgi:hypothetical protein
MRGERFIDAQMGEARDSSYATRRTKNRAQEKTGSLRSE